MIAETLQKLDAAFGVPAALPERGTLHARQANRAPRIVKPAAPEPAPLPVEELGGVDEIRRLLGSIRSDLGDVEAGYSPDAAPTARELERLRNVLERISSTASTAAQRVRVAARRANVAETGGQ